MVGSSSLFSKQIGLFTTSVQPAQPCRLSAASRPASCHVRSREICLVSANSGVIASRVHIPIPALFSAMRDETLSGAMV